MKLIGKKAAAALLLAIGTNGVAGTPAYADGYTVGPIGISVYQSSSSSMIYDGQCAFGYAAAGVGSGGATYLEGGAGAATNQPGAPGVVATSVRCALYKDGAWIYTDHNWTSGPASYAYKTFSSDSLNAGRVCVKIYAKLQNGLEVNSGDWSCSQVVT